MSVAGGSAAAWAAQERKKARKGIRRRVLAWVGLNPAARRADALTARTAHGTLGEQWTAALLTQLPAGWHVLHDRALPSRRPGGKPRQLDHVLVSPCGTAVIVLDSKKWHAQRETALVGGRVHCGDEDRHKQVETVADYATAVSVALAVPGVVVWPLLVVHASRVRDGRLDARAPGWGGPVWVLGADWLVPTLKAAPTGVDRARSVALAQHVARVLPPYLG